MKQYTNERQTAKLIELGVDTPRNFFESLAFADKSRCAYSIGELIEMLPQEFRNASNSYLSLSIHTGGLGTWDIRYLGFEAQIRTCEFELIDALFDMVVKLKEEGVI